MDLPLRLPVRTGPRLLHALLQGHVQGPPLQREVQEQPCHTEAAEAGVEVGGVSVRGGGVH